MAVIRIKRSTGTVAPSSLELGELAVTIDSSVSATYNNKAGRLFVGDAAGNPVVIGGEWNARLLDHEPGILNENSAVVVGSAGTIDNFYSVGLSTFNDLNVTGISTYSNIVNFDEYVSFASSVSFGSTTTVGKADFEITGLSTSSVGSPVIYFEPNGRLENNISFLWINDISQLYVEGGDVSAGRTSFGLAGIFTTGRIENLTVGSGATTYTFPTGRGTEGQILVSNANGVLGFATNDQRLNFLGDEFSGSVGLGSESFHILGGTNINTVAVGNGNTITVNLDDDVVIGGGLTVTGSMTVNGNLSYLSSTITQIEDKKIDLAVPDSGSPSDSTADGGGISIKGDSDYEIVWSNSRNAFTVNQSWEPVTGGAGQTSFNLGSDSAPWENLHVNAAASLGDVTVSSAATIPQATIQGGTINAATIGIGTSARARVTSLQYTEANGGITTTTRLSSTDANLSSLAVSGITTVSTLFSSTSPNLHGVGYAGTDGEVGFSSSPTAGISTSQYILTTITNVSGIGTVPVWTDTIDCGTY